MQPLTLATRLVSLLSLNQFFDYQSSHTSSSRSRSSGPEVVCHMNTRHPDAVWVCASVPARVCSRRMRRPLPVGRVNTCEHRVRLSGCAAVAAADAPREHRAPARGGARAERALLRVRVPRLQPLRVDAPPVPHSFQSTSPLLPTLPPTTRPNEPTAMRSALESVLQRHFLRFQFG